MMIEVETLVSKSENSYAGRLGSDSPFSDVSDGRALLFGIFNCSTDSAEYRIGSGRWMLCTEFEGWESITSVSLK